MANFVLVHGSFQGGWVWKPTAEALREAGHTVYAPTLQGCAERRHELHAGVTATTMAQELADLMFFEDIDGVILAGSSTGGIVMSKAAELAREKVKHLVYIDALAPQPGETVADIVIKDPTEPPNQETELARGVDRETLAKGLFRDLKPPLLDWALDRATFHPKAGSAADLTAFWSQTWSATVIYCALSRNPSEAHQRRTAEALNANWHTMNAGHYPMLNYAEETARLLIAAAVA